MSDDRRQHSRVEWISPGTIVFGRGRSELPCIVNNLSNGGVKLTEVMAQYLPDEFGLRLLPSKSPPKKCRVIWRAKYEVGIEFEEPLPAPGKPTKAKRKAGTV